ncbi:MAG: hypothetical protein WC178_05930, partial [Candidatus Paceibacterota bacterium]
LMGNYPTIKSDLQTAPGIPTMGRGGYIPMQMPLARAEMFTPSLAVALGAMVRVRARSRSLWTVRRAFPARTSVSGASGSFVEIWSFGI